ncbi:MAG TPA: succinate--CoA ligase subunit alpha [Anaerolineae bacterium]|nr:succinate--CoA ligase subunit alpha [Anaerolineae bacterium]
MAILLDEKTTMLIQGITGREGRARTRFMLAYGTRVVAGVTPGRGGSEVWHVPVYDTVQEAWKHHGPIDATVTFVPGPVVKDAVLEAIEAGIKLIVMPVERVPLHDALEMIACAREMGARIVGPGSFGVISAGKAVAGWIGGTEEFAREMFPPGHACPELSRRVGVISRSGGQTTTLSWAIGQVGLGISTALHIGAEPVVGTAPAELLPLFEEDEETHAVAMFGEIGTVAEEEAAEVIREGRFTKPLVAYIAGAGVKPGMRFSHASAIVERGRGSAESKIKALREAGAHVVDRPEELAPTLARVLGSGNQ